MLLSSRLNPHSIHHRKRPRPSPSSTLPTSQSIMTSSSSISKSPLFFSLPQNESLNSLSTSSSSSSSSSSDSDGANPSEAFQVQDQPTSSLRATTALSHLSKSNTSNVGNVPLQLDLLLNRKNKWTNWRIRTFWTLVMVTFFLFLILSAQVWVIFMVVAVQLLVFKEVIQIAHVPSKEKKLPWFRLITWYFLVATNYYFYGESVLLYFAHLIPPWLRPLATHHRLISFSLYCIGLVFFVLNLKKGYYKFQFSQFAWTHMALLLIVVQSHAVLNNIFEGLFWFFVPCSLVIVNDVFAYICGFFWGKTPLIKLSPKKTWEGFLGGAVCTMIFGLIISYILIRIPYFICPATDLRHGIWSSVHCKPNRVFIPQMYSVPSYVPLFGGQPFTFAPVQLHVMILSLFASSMAPFGGFFASGVKRAFKIKDFGAVIPGHGGITDRFDCQFVMGTFSFLYLSSFIGRRPGEMLALLKSIFELPVEEQWQIYQKLGNVLQQSQQMIHT